MRGILSGMPVQNSGVGPWLTEFTDHVRVEHEIHKDGGATRSGGMRSGSQSVAPRTDAYQDITLRMVGRVALLRRVRPRPGLADRLRAASHFSNSLAC